MMCCAYAIRLICLPVSIKRIGSCPGAATCLYYLQVLVPYVFFRSSGESPLAVGGGRGRGEGGAWRGRQLWLGRVALHHITMFDIYIPDFLRLRVVYLISASCWLHMRQPSSSSILSIPNLDPNLDPNLEAPLCQRFFFFFPFSFSSSFSFSTPLLSPSPVPSCISS